MTTTGRHGLEGAGEERQQVVISSPEELIASIPAMLGFPPESGSVVVICGRLAGGGQGPVVRLDAPGLVDHPGPDDDPSGTDVPAMDEGLARGLARFCARERVAEVHLVVVHDDCADSDTARARARETAEEIACWLEVAGTALATAYGVGEFSPGAAWIDLFGMEGGRQLDPDSTEIAAAYAYDGRIRARSRAEIEQLYRQRDPGARDVDRGRRPARLRGRPAVDAAVELHEGVARRADSGEPPADEDLAAVGTALLDEAVRDEVYSRLARAGLGDEDGRRTLWWALARRRPPRERSVALTLLGAAAYFEGSGVHARAALEAALDARPDNTLAGLLVDGLDRGLPPERLRRVAAA